VAERKRRNWFRYRREPDLTIEENKGVIEDLRR